jgi:diguanylate cyclase (GGDEF)-like protein
MSSVAPDRSEVGSSREDDLARARAEAERARELVATHGKVHELIAAGAPLEDVLVELINGVERQDPSVLGCVVLLDRESSTLHPGAGPSLPAEWLRAIDGVVIGPNIGSCGSAAWSGQLTISSDMAEDPKWAPIRDFAMASGLRHCWSMPIISSDGEVQGTFALYGAAPRSPDAEHLTLMEDSARMAGIAIERSRTLARLVHDARHDGLTGLPNRTRIFEALEDAMVRNRAGSHVAVMFVDLDGLKQLNDTLGHDRADEVLREIGQRLSSTVRERDFVGRFGGDEFVVIAESVPDETQASALGFRLLDAISQPLPGIDSLSVTASIGIALLSGADVDAREALRQADSAMYEAKRAGRDRCTFFEGSQRVHAGRRLTIARGLRGADLRDELRLVFQPVFDIRGGEIAGVEALLRWSSPELGDVSPGEFIPIAEDTRSIIPIGAWVMRESCETIAQVSAELGRPIGLSVNVSALQLGRVGFAQSVRQTLAHAELPTECLQLEITESALMRPDAVTVRSLSDLQELGVDVALDDFGTGFSSLSWLKQHPLGAIKIDRTFVAGLANDPRDRAIVAAVITMAHAVGCAVTAEGVETESQLEILHDLGCDRAQGFLLARPLPAADLAGLLRA